MVELHADTERIEAILRRYQVEARVEGGSLGPDVARYHLRLYGDREGTLAAIGTLAGIIAEALGRRECRVGTRRTAVFLEVPRMQMPAGALLFGDLLQLAGRTSVDTTLLGVTSDGYPLSWRLCNPAGPHVLVYGATGCGKTSLLRVVALGLGESQPAPRWRLVLLDGQGGLRELAALPHALGHTAGDDVRSWLVRLGDELDRRLAERERGGASRLLPRILTIMDEVERLVEMGGAATRSTLARLLEHGQEVGLHVAAATTVPDDLRHLASAFSVKLAGRSAEWPQVESGEFYMVAGGEPLRFRAAWASHHDVLLAAARWRRGRPRVAAQVIDEDGRESLQGIASARRVRCSA